MANGADLYKSIVRTSAELDARPVAYEQYANLNEDENYDANDYPEEEIDYPKFEEPIPSSYDEETSSPGFNSYGNMYVGVSNLERDMIGMNSGLSTINKNSNLVSYEKKQDVLFGTDTFKNFNGGEQYNALRFSDDLFGINRERNDDVPVALNGAFMDKIKNIGTSIKSKFTKSKKEIIPDEEISNDEFIRETNKNIDSLSEEDYQNQLIETRRQQELEEKEEMQNRFKEQAKLLRKQEEEREKELKAQQARAEKEVKDLEKQRKKEEREIKRAEIQAKAKEIGSSIGEKTQSAMATTTGFIGGVVEGFTSPLPEKSTVETPKTEEKSTEKTKPEEKPVEKESKAKSVGKQTGSTIKVTGKKIGRAVQNMQEVKSKISKEEFFDIKQKYPDESFKASGFGGMELFPTFTKPASAQAAKTNMGGSSLGESLGFGGLFSPSKESPAKTQGMGGYSLGESLGVGMFGSSTQAAKTSMGGSSLNETLGFGGLFAPNSPSKSPTIGTSLDESLGFAQPVQFKPPQQKVVKKTQKRKTKRPKKSTQKKPVKQ